jgi:amidase
MVRLMSVGTMSCREVIDARPARIDTVNPAVNALVAPADPESCPTAADEADGRLARDDPLDGRTDCRWSSRS